MTSPSEIMSEAPPVAHASASAVSPVRPFYWSVRRELWENRAVYVGPLIAAAVVLAGILIATVHPPHFEQHGRGPHMTVAELRTLPYAISAVLIMVIGVVVGVFYSLGALHNERRDRSLLFWKSLPISDAQTVLSKALLALVLAPLFIIVLGSALTGLQLLLFCAAMAAKGVNAFGPILGNPAFYLAPLRLLAVLPVYALWALPTVGWLLLVSAWARSKVFLWAVGLPLLAGVLAVWANRLLGLDVPGGWFFHNIVGRGLLGTAPGSWLLFERDSLPLDILDGTRHLDMSNFLQYSWATLGGASAWIGALAGAAMIHGAIRLRGSRDEG